MTAVAAGLGLVADRLLGEPPIRWHPVVWFGTTMNAVESRWWADDRLRGAAYTAAGVAVAVAPACALTRLVGPSLAAVVATGICSAGAMLERETQGVAAALLADDVEGARERVGRLVGRRTDTLAPSDIARAAIETLAENTVDAITATLFWASVGGATGALVHRAVNTMDAMVGHHTALHERFGFASARLDDAMNWLPARLTALACAVATPSRAVEIRRTVAADADGHPSPNGGVVEAAFAAALGVRLGGVNEYGDVREDRGVLGNGRSPTAHDIRRAVALARRVTLVTAVACLGVERGCRRVVRSEQTRRHWTT